MQDPLAGLQTLIQIKENTNESVIHENLMEACARTAGQTLEKYLQTAINLFPSFLLSGVCRNSIELDYLRLAIANATDIITHAGPDGLNGLILMSVRPLSKMVQGQKIAWLKVVCTSNKSNDSLKGLPRYLMFRALRRAKDCGATLAVLHSTDWPDITRFYHELGFRCVRRKYDSLLSHDELFRLLYTSYPGWSTDDMQGYVLDLRKKLLSEDELAKKYENGRLRQLVEMPELDETKQKSLFDVLCNKPVIYAKKSRNVFFGGPINKTLTDALKNNKDKLQKYKKAHQEFADELIKKRTGAPPWEHTDVIKEDNEEDNDDAPGRPQTRSYMRAQAETLRSLRGNTTNESITARTDNVSANIVTDESQTSTVEKKPPMKPAQNTTQTPPTNAFHLLRTPKLHTEDNQKSTKRRNESSQITSHKVEENEHPESSSSSVVTPEDAPTHEKSKENKGHQTVAVKVEKNAHPKSSASSKGDSSAIIPKKFPSHEEFAQMLEKGGFTHVDKVNPKIKKDKGFAFMVGMEDYKKEEGDFDTYLHNKLKTLDPQIRFQPYVGTKGGTAKKQQYLIFFTNQHEKIESMFFGTLSIKPGNALVWDSSATPGGISWPKAKGGPPQPGATDRFRVVMA